MNGSKQPTPVALDENLLRRISDQAFTLNCVINTLLRVDEAGLKFLTDLFENVQTSDTVDKLLFSIRDALYDFAPRGLSVLRTKTPDSWLCKFIDETLADVEQCGVEAVLADSAMVAKKFISLYNAAGEEARHTLKLMEAAKVGRNPLEVYAAMPALTMPEH